MAVPAFLSSSFRYLETLTVTNVNTLITDIYAELVTNGSPAWTGSVTGTPGTTNYTVTATSPARSDGISVTMTGVWVSATRIKFTATDAYGLLINNQTTNQLDIDAGGTTIHYYTGELHFCISSERAAPEAFMFGVCDRTPEGIADPFPFYIASQGPRGNTGVLANQQWYSMFLKLLTGTAYQSNVGGGMGRNANIACDFITVSGQNLFAPVEVTDSASISHGRLFQCLLCDSQIANAADLTVPIDVSTTATFKVVGFSTGATSTTAQCKVAFRKA